MLEQDLEQIRPPTWSNQRVGDFLSQVIDLMGMTLALSPYRICPQLSGKAHDRDLSQHLQRTGKATMDFQWAVWALWSHADLVGRLTLFLERS